MHHQNLIPFTLRLFGLTYNQQVHNILDNDQLTRQEAKTVIVEHWEAAGSPDRETVLLNSLDILGGELERVNKGGKPSPLVIPTLLAMLHHIRNEDKIGD